MSTDRPGSPETPDRPTPDPAHPAESHTAPADPAHPGHEHYPLPADPDAETAGTGDTDPTVRFTAEPTTPGQTPRGHEPTLALPNQSASGSDESRSGTGGFGEPGTERPAGYPPTLPMPADFGAEHGGEHHGPHHLAGEFHGGPGAFGRPGDGGPTAAPGPLLGNAGFVLPGPVLEPEEPALPATMDEPAAPPRRGSITTQEAGVTRPRPPTVAEARAREKARKRAEAQERAEAEAAEAKQRKKKRLLVGGAAVVGIAALVGGGYLVAEAWNGPEVTAYCTVVANKGETVPTGQGQSVTATQDNQEIVVPDNYCSDAQDHGDGGIHPGFFFLAGHSYRYYYGGSGTIGHAPSGGSTTAPKGSTVKTKSGSTIQRGGLGAKIHGGGS
ncbi:hypothetical protein [Nocardia sp. NPDC046763]|uniref:hypothetical protein n=1 Tax=Nocardia sp. NPDC046763 TaxID=3155256 RepID=UPI00340DFA54